MKNNISTIFEKLDLLGFDSIEAAQNNFLREPHTFDLEVLSTAEICELDEWIRQTKFM